MEGLDEASLDTIIQLQQEELTELLDAENSWPGNFSDGVIALQASLAELNILKDTYADHHVATDLELNPSDTENEHGDDQIDVDIQETQNPVPVETRQCTVCFERVPVPQIVIPPCGESYCTECIRELFRASFRDESLFPPRCCTQLIPLESVENILPARDIQTYQEKIIEFGTPNRTYCHRPQCLRFIPPEDLHGDSAYCRVCFEQTCALCKSKYHAGDCPEDPALRQVLELAAEQNWQRCPNCRTMVELRYGCNHITCVCSHQFCYQCAARWKTCACPQWQERLLVEHAQRLVQRDNNDNQNAEQAVEAAAQMLRERHECRHLSWRSLSGPHRCEVCEDRLSVFILECRQCRILMCRECKSNRLR